LKERKKERKVIMTERIFSEMIKRQWRKNKFVSVGLDSNRDEIPKVAWKETDEETLSCFNCAIIDSTRDIVCVYKPNIAFYEGMGLAGLSALIRTVAYIKQYAPDVPVIGDTKADIGNTNQEYVKSVFEIFGFDAVTISPYLGGEALQPFLDREDKGIFVLCRTSNPGAEEFQDLLVRPVGTEKEAPLYEYVASQVANQWNENGNCGLVVGATYSDELAEVRNIVGDNIPILIPAIGAQGGKTEAAVKAGKNSRGQGMIINSSRAIIFASKERDFAEVARQKTLELHNMINQYRELI